MTCVAAALSEAQPSNDLLYSGLGSYDVFRDVFENPGLSMPGWSCGRNAAAGYGACRASRLRRHDPFVLPLAARASLAGA